MTTIREDTLNSLEGDGALFCANSWGGEFGDDGIFVMYPRQM